MPLTTAEPPTTADPRQDPILAMTVEDAGYRIGLSPRQAWRLVMSGELASVRIGRARRVRLSDLEAFLAARTA